MKDSNQSIDQLSKDFKLIKSEINKLEVDNVRVQGEMARLGRDINTPRLPETGMLSTAVKPINSKLDQIADRISSLEESVQQGIDSNRSSQAKSNSNPRTPKDTSGDEEITPKTPKTPQTRTKTSDGSEKQEGNIYKPVLSKSNAASRGTPRMLSKNELFDDDHKSKDEEKSGKIPLQHTPSTVEF